MQLALYRAERPEIFEEIIGQKHIVKILQNQIRTGTVSQAYLFSGTHGTGKTTTARILAKAVNCLNAQGSEDAQNSDLTEVPIPCGHCANCEAIREGRFVDCIELDAASNNSVDDLRTIIEMVKYPPTIGKYKVYIIDEVHMLSAAAENAFLKTLEEPPQHAIFILATTDPQKVRSTIRSRCMQLNFKRVSEEELVAGMYKICKKRGVETTQDALTTIASRADGSVRDALSILEQCMAGGEKALNRSLVLEYTGAAGDDFFIALTEAVSTRNIGNAMLYIDEIARRGKDCKQILKDWLTHYRNLMIVKCVAKAERIIGSSSENIDRLRDQASRIDIREIERAVRLISEYINIGRVSDRPRILLEMVAVRITCRESDEANVRSSAQLPRGASVAPSTQARSKARNISQEKTSEPPTKKEAASTIERIAPAPREAAGDPAKMWDSIADEVSRTETIFCNMIEGFVQAQSYSDGELHVIVKASKARYMEERSGRINDAAKLIYGDGVYVTFSKGDVDANQDVRYQADENSEMQVSQEEAISEIKDSLKNLTGMDIEII